MARMADMRDPAHGQLRTTIVTSTPTIVTVGTSAAERDKDGDCG
jgi:hypothetical protein